MSVAIDPIPHSANKVEIEWKCKEGIITNDDIFMFVVSLEQRTWFASETLLFILLRLLYLLS